MSGWPWQSFALAAAGVFLVGFSKAGFGGGLGVLAIPLAIIGFQKIDHSPKYALGVLLPLFCAADLFSLKIYWGKWRKENLKYLLPGVLVGTLLGLGLMGRFSPRQMNVVIGVICMIFVLFQLAKERVFAAEGAFAPNHAIGVPCGVVAGVTSTFANGGGPVVAMFLVPQKLPKEIYVGTTVLTFAWVNLIKLVFFIPGGIVSAQTAKGSLFLLPFVPAGVWAGLQLNRMLPEKLFLNCVYLFTFATGLYLVIG